MEIFLRRQHVHPGIPEHRVPEGPWLVGRSDLAEWAHPDDSRDEKDLDGFCDSVR